jgi:hypothetical protein
LRPCHGESGETPCHWRRGRWRTGGESRQVRAVPVGAVATLAGTIRAGAGLPVPVGPGPWLLAHGARHREPQPRVPLAGAPQRPPTMGKGSGQRGRVRGRSMPTLCDAPSTARQHQRGPTVDQRSVIHRRAICSATSDPSQTVYGSRGVDAASTALLLTLGAGGSAPGRNNHAMKSTNRRIWRTAFSVPSR